MVKTALSFYNGPIFVKDNIDVKNIPTTDGCPSFSYDSFYDSKVVDLLKGNGAGAIVIGKTNLDQFATGLVGTRSPYGKIPLFLITNTYLEAHLLALYLS